VLDKLRNNTLKKMHTKIEVDFNNQSEREAYLKQLQKKAGENIRHAVNKLRAAGIIDQEGKRVRKELPTDMRPDSQCRIPR